MKAITAGRGGMRPVLRQGVRGVKAVAMGIAVAGLGLALLAGCTPTEETASVEGAAFAAGPSATTEIAGAFIAAARPLAIADVLSVVATKKTIIDHAASLTTGLDCSTVRSLNGGNYCEKPYVNQPPALATLYCYRELSDVTCYDQPMPYQHLVAVRPGGRQTVY